jgi:hypothetical protein
MGEFVRYTTADVAMLSRAAEAVVADRALPLNVATALAALFRRTAWVGGLDLEMLHRLPCDEVIDTARAVLALHEEADRG